MTDGSSVHITLSMLLNFVSVEKILKQVIVNELEHMYNQFI